MPFESITPTEFAKRREEGWNPYVLDVRGPAESAEAHLAFTDALEPHTSVTRIADKLPRDRDIVVYCRSGGRSAMACQVLNGMGFDRLHNLEGGMMGWSREVGTDIEQG